MKQRVDARAQIKIDYVRRRGPEIRHEKADLALRELFREGAWIESLIVRGGDDGLHRELGKGRVPVGRSAGLGDHARTAGVGSTPPRRGARREGAPTDGFMDRDSARFTGVRGRKPPSYPAESGFVSSGSHARNSAHES